MHNFGLNELISTISGKEFSSSDCVVQEIQRIGSKVGLRKNLYVFDLSDENPLNFSLHGTVQNIDMQGMSTSLRDYPDLKYVEEKVIPNYLIAKRRSEVAVDRVTSVIQGFIATYDRAIIPLQAKSGKILSVSMTDTKLLVDHVNVKQVLTERQAFILSMVAEGWSAKEIAAELGLSNRTVEHHLEAIKRNMRAKNVSHAVSMYVAWLTLNE